MHKQTPFYEYIAKKRILCWICYFLLNLLANNSTVANTIIINAKAKNIAATTINLHPKLAKLAFQTFYKAKTLGVQINKPIVTVIDYSLPSCQKRLWVLDLEHNKILHTSLVAHGRNSGENHTKHFSNNIGSQQTSLGLFLTGNTYFGKEGYSLKMIGLETGYNNNAEKRTIVLHSAPYVSQKFIAAAGRIGRSWGCPAIETPLAKPIINIIKDGSLILAYYPDKHWLKNSRFINYHV